MYACTRIIVLGILFLSLIFVLKLCVLDIQFSIAIQVILNQLSLTLVWRLLYATALFA